jgi:hypothetical protein
MPKEPFRDCRRRHCHQWNHRNHLSATYRLGGERVAAFVDQRFAAVITAVR